MRTELGTGGSRMWQFCSALAQMNPVGGDFLCAPSFAPFYATSYMHVYSQSHTHTCTTTGTPSKNELQKSPSPLLMINRISFSFFAATEFLNATHIIAVVVIANAISCCLCMSCAQNATHGRRGKTALRASDGCWAGKESRKWQNRITANCMGVSSVVFVFVFLIFFPGTLDIFVLALPQFEFR